VALSEYIFGGIAIVWLGFLFWVQTRTTPISDTHAEINIFGQRLVVRRRRRGRELMIRRRP
jgi:hypothetical protein